MVVRPEFYGWPYAITPVPWGELAEHFDARTEEHPSLSPMRAIVRSVIEGGAAERLGAITSIDSLIVVPLPVPEPPMPVIWVHAPGRIATVPRDHVLIAHDSGTGRDDSISRPAQEAVALFWRFMIEKYGVHPVRTCP